MNNIEELMSGLVRASVDLKRKLYRRDDVASTTPEGIDGPRTTVHVCRLCNRAAAGNDAQVRHKSDCPLARLQTAQKALRGAWPELFIGEWSHRRNGRVRHAPGGHPEAVIATEPGAKLEGRLDGAR